MLALLAATPATAQTDITVEAFAVDRRGVLEIHREGGGNPLFKHIVVSGSITCVGGGDGDVNYTLVIFAFQRGEEVGNTGGVGGPALDCSGDTVSWTATLFQTFEAARPGRTVLRLMLAPITSGGNLFVTSTTVVLRPTFVRA